MASVAGFFADANGTTTADLGLTACTGPVARVDFLHAPLFSYQARYHWPRPQRLPSDLA